MAAFPASNNRRRTGSERQFPGRLHNMMAYAEKEGYEHVIGWVLNGRGVMVYNPEGLVNLLPLFFSQTKYRSFRRQLNMWHFERLEHGPNKGAFVHPYFVRDNRELCSCMCRQMHIVKPRNPEQSLASTEPEHRISLRTRDFDPIAYDGSQQDNSIIPFHEPLYSSSQTAQNNQEFMPTSCAVLEPSPIFNVQLGGNLQEGRQETSFATSSGFLTQRTENHVPSSRYAFDKSPSSVVDKEQAMWHPLQRKMPPMTLSKALPLFVEKNEAPIGLEPISLDGLFPFGTPTSTDPLDMINLDDFDFST